MQNFKKFFFFFLKLISGVYLFFLFMFFLASMGWLGELPSIEDIKNPKKILATQIISSDYEVLGKFFLENRTELQYHELPPHLVNALIATEDYRFYEHSAIDLYGLVTAMARTVFLFKPSGASTITQQLAKNLFHDIDRGNIVKRILQKFKEWHIAIQLEKNFSKQEIIALYFNTVPFVHNSFGLKEATKTYYNKDVKLLTIDEAAVMVGMLKGPALYNPKSHPKNALSRRNTVLEQMEKYQFIDESALDSLKKKPIVIDFHLTAHNTGLAPHFREQLRMEVTEILKKYSKKDGTPYNIYSDGLRIFTTIDSRMQTYAEQSMSEHMAYMQSVFEKEWGKREPWKYGDKANPELINHAIKTLPQYQSMKENGIDHEEIIAELSKKQKMTIYHWNGNIDTMLSPIDSLKYYKKILQAGLLAVDPTTGEVKAWVGGCSFENFKLDHVRKSTKRQVGSTIKPLLYAVAIQNGKSPCFEVPYESPNIDGFTDWDPRGSKNFIDGQMVSLRDGLQVSDNKIAAQLIKMFGVGSLIEMAKSLKIDSKFDPVPTICLGVTDISLYEMVGSYTPFMNKGIYSKPFYIRRIEDAKGNIIYDESQVSSEVLDERTAILVNLMMQHVTVGRGTAARVRRGYGMKQEIAAKTGTTQSNSDGWFIGGMPQILCGVWVGADDPSICFATTGSGQGASSALPIWAKFMNRSFADRRLKLDYKASFLHGADSVYRAEIQCSAEDTTLVPIPEIVE
jgi:penicillin-binding protein 1A